MLSVNGSRTDNTAMQGLFETIKMSTEAHEELLAVLPLEVSFQDDANGGSLDAISAFSHWLDSNYEGFYVKDLDSVCAIIDRLMEYLVVDFPTTEPVLERLLEICSMPLMEVKANERLSTRGYSQINNYFRSVSDLFSVSNNATRIKIAKCFRCIANGGKDPTILRSQQPRWQPDGVRLRITDSAFVERVLRESGALETVVMKYLDVCEDLHYKSTNASDGDLLAPTTDADDFEIHEKAVAAAGDDPYGSADSSVFNDADDQSNAQASLSLSQRFIYDDPELYGVPKSFLAARQQQEEKERQQQEEVDAVRELNDQGMINTDDEFLGAQDETASPSNQSDAASSPMGKAFVKSRTRSHDTLGSQLADDSPVILRDLSQVMLQLCLELSRDTASALAMCKFGICSGCVIMIEKDSKLNPRDKRIGVTIELMWNVLEAAIDHFKSNSSSPDEVRSKLDTFSQKFPIADFSNAIYVLQTNLIYVLNEGFRLSDKELRNEIIIILTLLAHFPCAVAHFIEQRLLHLLITYACFEETGNICQWDGFISNIAKLRNFATPSDVDFEFKKALWFLISELLRERKSAAPAIFASSPLQLCMLHYIEHDSFERKAAVAAVGEGSMEMHQLTAGSLNASQHESPSMLDPLYAGSSSPQQPQSNAKHVLMSKTFAGAEEHKHSRSPLMNATMPSLQSASAHGKKQQQQQLKSITGSNSVVGSSKKRSLIALMPLSKLREFQVLAITFLQHNAPIVMPHFEELHGPARVVAITVKYCQSEVPDHKQLIFNALILLQRCLVHSLSVRQLMEQQDLMRTYLHVYHKSEHEQTRAQALALVGCLCIEGNVDCQRNFHRLGGITDLVAHITQYVCNRPPLAGTKAGININAKSNSSGSSSSGGSNPDPLENPYGGEISMVVIAALDCLNKAVVGNASNENHFADAEGLDVLLELVETSPMLLRIQALRLLADLLQNTALVCFVNAWRSAKTLRSAAQILCHSWQDEEARLVGEKRRDGIIRDVWHPLSKEDATAVSAALAAAQGRDDGEEEEQQSQLSPGSVATYESTAEQRESSLTVTKLAAAILAGRNATQTNLPIDICNQLLLRDSRVLIAELLRAIGVFEIYATTTVSVADANDNDNEQEQQEQQQMFEEQKYESMQQSQEEDPSTLLMMQSGSSDDGDAFMKRASLTQSRSPFQTKSSPPAASTNAARFNATAPAASRASAPTTTLLAQSPTTTAATNKPAAAAAGGVLSSTASDLGLTPKDRQIVAMAKRYAALREGEWWQSVRDCAAAAGITPIEADQALMDARLQFSCVAAAAVQQEQIALFDDDQHLKQQEEDVFIDQIVTKKNQQIKAEWLKKKGRTIRF